MGARVAPQQIEATMHTRKLATRPKRRSLAPCVAAAIALAACTSDVASPDSGSASGPQSQSTTDAGTNIPNFPATTDASSATADGASSTGGQDSGSTSSTPEVDGGTAEYSWPSDCDTHYTLRAHNNSAANDTSKKEVAAGSQYYASYYYRVPWGTADIQGLKFRTMIDNTKIVHHWILYGVNSGTQQDGSVQGGQGQAIGSMPGEFYIAGWAPGAPDIALPDGVGLHMPTGANAMLRLEIHYFNTASDSKNEADASGVEFCVTSHKRPAEAAIHWLGTPNVNVAATGTTNIKSTCKPRITKGPVHLLSLSSHMHQTGVHSSAILHRANSAASETLIDDPFSFLEQRGYKQPRDGSAADVLINAGDTIDVTCTYDNTTGQPKKFGSNTEDEMCFFYAMAWPRGQLANGSLYSVVPGAEPEVDCLQ